MKALLIAEKPSLKRAIEVVYQKHKGEIPYEITFMEQRGHLLTLKSPDEIDESLKEWSWDNLPFHPEDYGGFKYKVIDDKKVGSFLTSKERYQKIKKELSEGDYDFVINAGDPDQEGQLLIRIVLAAVKCKIPIKRYWTNATTEEKILEALLNLRDDEKDAMLVNLLESAYVRQHSDYRFGMNASRAATIKMGARVACGRVKTPILAIVCQRENEIKSFVPSTCYGIKALYEEGFDGSLYEEKEGEDKEDKEDAKEDAGIIWFDTEKEAKEIIDDLSKTARVTKFESKKVESFAPKLFKLATAQIAAGKLGYSSVQTLEIIQSLYDKGYMSYPRTDCEYLSSTENLKAMIESVKSVPELKGFVDKIEPSVIGKVKATKKWVNDKALEESGHSALAPTTKAPDFSTLSEDEKTIYTLICRQFIAIFMPPLVQNKTLFLAKAGDRLFKSTGKTLISPGYTEVFNTRFTDNEIPEHKEGDMVDISEFNITTKTTTCPKRFSDADLIAVCEAPHKFLDDKHFKSLGKKLKIGTPATRANIIDTLITKDKYLQRTKEKKTEYLTPTDFGMSVYENLKGRDIAKVDMTGVWEEKLELIRSGKESAKDVEAFMKQSVEELIKDIKYAEMNPVSKPGRKILAKCPKCGGDLISGAKGFFCSKYKEGCKMGTFKTLLGATISDNDFMKLLEKKTIKKKLTKKDGSKSWEQELVYNFDECKIDFVKMDYTQKETEYKCPKCENTIIDANKLYKCNDECGFKFFKTQFGKPIPEKEIKAFFTDGKTSLISGFKSIKTGKEFSARLVLSDDKKGTKPEFDNANSKK